LYIPRLSLGMGGTHTTTNMILLGTSDTNHQGYSTLAIQLKMKNCSYEIKHEQKSKK